MNELRELFAHGTYYPRMTVADVVDRDPSRKINKAPAFNVPDFRVFRPRGVKVARSADTPRRRRLLSHLQFAVREMLQRRIDHGILRMKHSYSARLLGQKQFRTGDAFD
jgi:hypothetical protein